MCVFFFLKRFLKGHANSRSSIAVVRIYDVVLSQENIIIDTWALYLVDIACVAGGYAAKTLS